MIQPNKTSKRIAFDMYDAVMTHGYDADVFKRHFDAAGLPCADLSLEDSCLLHTRLVKDAVIKERTAKEITARQARFASEPFMRLADCVTEQLFREMSKQELVELRERVTGVLKIKK